MALIEPSALKFSSGLFLDMCELTIKTMNMRNWFKNMFWRFFDKLCCWYKRLISSFSPFEILPSLTTTSTVAKFSAAPQPWCNQLIINTLICLQLLLRSSLLTIDRSAVAPLFVQVINAACCLMASPKLNEALRFIRLRLVWPQLSKTKKVNIPCRLSHVK